jgi:hypothetical protein
VAVVGVVLGAAIGIGQIVVAVKSDSDSGAAIPPSPAVASSETEPSPSPVERGGSPLTITSYHGSSEDWVIPLAEAEILAQRAIPREGPGPDGVDLTKDDVHCLHRSRINWIRNLGGVPGGGLMIPITATVNLDSVVLLKEIEVDVIEKQPAFDGTTVALCVGAGPVDVYSAYVDLDAPEPKVRVFGPSGSSYDSTEFPRFEVDAGETQEFRILALTQESYVKFTLDLHFLVNGEDVVERVDNDGQAFDVTACTSPAVQVDYLGSPDGSVFSESCGLFPS